MAQLTSRQLAEWMAFASIEPIGADREDLHTAMQLSLTYNRHRGKNEAPQTVTAFLESLRNVPKPDQSIEEQLSILGRVLKRK